MKSEAKFGTVLTRLIIALVLIFVLGCDSGSGGGGGDTKSVKCLENDIVGPWILDWDTRADDSYIEFGTGGEIKGFQGIGTLSGTNPYTINGDCTFEGEMNWGSNTYLLDGVIRIGEDGTGYGSFDMWPELDPNVIYPSSMEKVIDISALEGDWEGEYFERGKYGDHLHQIEFSLGPAGNFQDFSGGLGVSVNRGKFYATPLGAAVGHIILNQASESRYDEMVFYGAFSETTGEMTIEGKVYLDTNDNDEITNSFSVKKIN